MNNGFSARPADALTMMHGIFVKIGKYDRVFNWINGEWLRSTKTAEEVRGHMRNMKKNKKIYE